MLKTALLLICCIHRQHFLFLCCKWFDYELQLWHILFNVTTFLILETRSSGSLLMIYSYEVLLHSFTFLLWRKINSLEYELSQNLPLKSKVPQTLILILVILFFWKNFQYFIEDTSVWMDILVCRKHHPTQSPLSVFMVVVSILLWVSN